MTTKNIQAVVVRSATLPATIKKQLVNIKRRAKNIEVYDERSAKNISEFGTELTRFKEILTTMKRKELGPIEAKYATFLDVITPAQKEVKEKLSAYATKEQEKKAAKIEKIMDAGIPASKKIEKIEKIEGAPSQVKSEVANVHYREDKFVVVDDISLIPREFLMVDIVKLNAAMLTDGRNVKGARIETKMTPVFKKAISA